jgi:hypothetical protein
MDPDDPNYPLYMKQGAEVIKAAEAQPGLAKQAKDNEARAADKDDDD